MSKEYPDIESTVQKYVLGQLSSVEEETFEEYFIVRPDVIEMIEIAQALHAGFVASGNVKEASSNVSPKAKSGRSGFGFEQLKRWVSIPVPAYAALLIAVVGTQYPAFLVSTDETGDSLIMAHFSTDTIRSNRAEPQLDLSNMGGTVGLEVRIPKVDHAQYKISFIDLESGEELWTSSFLELDSTRAGAVKIPTTLLGRTIGIRVYGISESGEKEKVPFCDTSEQCSSK